MTSRTYRALLIANSTFPETRSTCPTWKGRATTRSSCATHCATTRPACSRLTTCAWSPSGPWPRCWARSRRQLAHDAHVRDHASLFTHHLAAGLLAGADDHDGDGLVTLSELYDYVHAALAEEGRQVPQKHFSGDGDVAVALRAPRPD